ncbi:MAG: nickel pincer cofactor biosynthesis protein LarB, partial [Chloroflexota bacterium]|nr:nickel pincer cofactor biosynthesis protein LarB [Chloroflexota bacterium]
MRRAAPDPFDALRAALRLEAAEEPAINETYPVRLDTGREARLGVPEVIYAPGKSPNNLVEAVRGLLASRGRVIVSRVDDAHTALLRARFPDALVQIGDGMRTARVTTEAYDEPFAGGQVGIVTAGTSDLPAADEARVMAEAMGCVVRLVADVGVAGLHRLFPPLISLLEWGADALIVAAGMDGALPSVIAGLVPLPVIGLPTMIGYGAGGQGEAALLAMLQTCAPGLTVVNIDNGIGAGIAAARIANQSVAAFERRGSLRARGRPAARGE